MSDHRFQIDGSSAIVTGASRGIGRQIAERFTARGLDTTICSREQDDIDAVAAELADDHPGGVLPIACDVRDRNAVETMVDRTLEEFGRLDVLVNNAGAAFRCAFDDLSENAWKTIVDVNLHGVYNCTHAAGPALRDGGGSVVNISSIRGLEAAPRQTHYSASKGGVNSLTRSLASEWAEDGIRVNAVAPGFIATPGAVTSGGRDPSDVDRSVVDRRVGTPAEIADVVEFLASPAASFVVGEVLTARGVPSHSEDPD